tara:strand:+ start:2319 stop:4025 length:1707 start_codon:yes stop_codon:yes gene_type:complete
MAGWKKHFQTYNTSGSQSPLTGSRSRDKDSASRFQSWLPEVYVGQPNRIERYMQYDQMDMDSEVNTAVDTIAEFSTQRDEETETPFIVKWNDTPTETESEVLQTVLKQWCRVNEWNKRLFKTFRNTIKYGDQPFLRDPETWKLYYVNPGDVMRVIVDEAAGKEPSQYIIKNVDPNFQNLTATTAHGSGNHAGGAIQSNALSSKSTGQVNNTNGLGTEMESMIDAKHVIHLALTEGMDTSWPFGNSVLDAVFKTYKQKELLEDSIIIYRVQRAPERRIFYIDVGDMPAHQAMSHVERVKNEIHQRRIPSRTGGGSNMMDAQYNPLSIMEDYFFAQTAEGRGSKVDTLPGGQNLGDIDDLKFFNNKLARGLGIPSSYLPSGPDDGSAMMNDGRVGTAFIQEYRFTQYCQRLQRMVQPTFDKEFKLFLKNRGYEIDSSQFELDFVDPQSFSDYREIEINSARAGAFGQIEGIDYISKRFALKKYLQLSESEILENEKMWKQENPIDGPSGPGGDNEDFSDLGSVGVMGGGDGSLDDFEADDFDGEEEEFGGDEGESPVSGAEAGEDDGEEL